MKNKIIILGVLIIGVLVGLFLRHNRTTWLLIKNPVLNLYNTPNNLWSKDFILVDIKSSIDNNIQKAYYYKSKSKSPKPLIVSLHTWGGDYTQFDKIAEICKQKDLNYIHPDFRGANRTKHACCSEYALTDIDDAITFALTNLNVDPLSIYIVGVSGGGYATISSFMKSSHKIKKFSAWAPITDLIAWHNEGKIRSSVFVEDILDCTDSGNQLNINNAKNKSPIYWDTPVSKLIESKVSIHAGVFDGIQGSVPITHSINFYNKVLKNLDVLDTSKYVSASEKLKLLEFRKPLGDYGFIGGRKVYLKKEYKNISLIIFEGDHEILPEFAINDLLSN